MPSSPNPPKPIALHNDEGEALWFLGTLATIKASGATTGGRFALIEQLAAKGAGSPLHVHRREDEWFYVIEGELGFWVGGQRIAAPAGAFVYGPRDIPHTFAVVSDKARFLVGAEPAEFEDFLRALAEPARARTLPPTGGPPPDPARLTAVAAQYGIEIMGPPGLPD
jgi:quercetin dioxygenase-like cupin family protein